MTTIHDAKKYTKGWRAFFDQMTRDTNPYTTERDRALWFDGWDDAKEFDEMIQDSKSVVLDHKPK